MKKTAVLVLVLAALASPGLVPQPVAASASPGGQLWVSRYNGPANGGDDARSVAVSPSTGTVFVTGYSQGATSGFDYATLAYDPGTGPQLWVSRYNGPANSSDEASAVAVSPDGNTVFVTGKSQGTGTSSGYGYATVAYRAATGARLWSRRYNGPASNYDAASSVTVSPNGATVFVTGASLGTATGEDYATVAYNAATGAQLWVKRYNGAADGNDVASSVAVSPDGGHGVRDRVQRWGHLAGGLRHGRL